MVIIGRNRRFPGLSRRIGSRFDITSSRKYLPFSAGSFARAADAYLLAKNSSNLYEMTGPFAANVLATRVIGGKKYGLFEGEFSTENTYSEVFRAAISDWDNGDVDVTDNAGNDPLENTTSDLITENTANSTHYVRGSFAPDGSSQYYFLFFVKPNGRNRCVLRFGSSGFIGLPNAFFRFDTEVVYNATDCDDYGLIKLANGWYLIYISGTSDVASSAAYTLYFVDSGNNYTYIGDGTSGIYVWGANVIKAEHWTNYIQAISSPEAKPADVLYYANADLPSWLKGSQNKALTLNLTPNYASSQVSVDKFIFSINGTENVECYIDSANKINIDVDSVSKFQSTAKTWALHADPKITIVPNDGANCKVITSGFATGNGTETGTIFSMQDDGILYQGCRHTTNDLQFGGMLSEFRPGYV